MLNPAPLDLNFPDKATAGTVLERLLNWFRESQWTEDGRTGSLYGHYEWVAEMGDYSRPKHRDLVLDARHRLVVELVRGTESYVLHVNLLLPFPAETEGGRLWRGQMFPLLAAKCLQEAPQFAVLERLTRLFTT